MAMVDSLFGQGQERAEHELTLRRTALAIAWAAGLLFVLLVGTVAVTEGSLSGASGTLALMTASLLVGCVVAGLPVLLLALWLLRRLGRGRAARIVVGGLAGLAIGLVEELLMGGMSPWAFVHDEPGFATMVLLWPLVAGAIAGAIVGPRRAAVAEGPGPDEQAEDALLDGAD